MTNLQRLITRSLMACLLPVVGIYFIFTMIKGIADREFPVTTLTWVALAAFIQTTVITSLIDTLL